MADYYLDHGNENAAVKKEEDGSLKRLRFIPPSWEPLEEFSEEIEPISEEDVKKLIDAFHLAKTAHEGQKDKAGKPYIEHPLRVSQLVEGGIDEILTALLHDVVEDTPLTLEDLKARGYSDRVVDAVDCVSKRSDETRQEYLDRLKPNETARRVKIADLTHNSDLSRIPDPKERDFERIENYKKELEYLRNQ